MHLLDRHLLSIGALSSRLQVSPVPSLPSSFHPHLTHLPVCFPSSSATKAGIDLLPAVVCQIVALIFSGRMIARFGRYVSPPLLSFPALSDLSCHCRAYWVIVAGPAFPSNRHRPPLHRQIHNEQVRAHGVLAPSLVLERGCVCRILLSACGMSLGRSLRRSLPLLGRCSCKFTLLNFLRSRSS